MNRTYVLILRRATAEFQVFESPDEEINDDLLDGADLKFPLFIKPSREDTGMGVSARSIIKNVKDLREGLKDMLSRYRQPILCERFIEGRELTVGLVGNLKTTAARRISDRTAPNILPDELTFFPPLELNVDKYDESEAGLYTNRVKVELVDDWHYTCPANIDSNRKREIFEYSAAVFRVLGCRDVSRIDFRLDKSDNDKPYILEINPLPGLNPKYSDLPIEAYAHGWTYDMLIGKILSLASERWNVKGT